MVIVYDFKVHRNLNEPTHFRLIHAYTKYFIHTKNLKNCIIMYDCIMSINVNAKNFNFKHFLRYNALQMSNVHKKVEKIMGE